MTKYPNSACAEHKNVRTGDPVCIICMEDELTALRARCEKAEKEAEHFDFAKHLQRQRDWSSKTFGPDPRVNGVVSHIRKELDEILADPTDISEWIDVAILALDGAWRAGYSPEQIIEALVAKQTKNESRKWPDWKTCEPDTAIEHDRSGDAAIAKERMNPAEPKPKNTHQPIRMPNQAGPCNTAHWFGLQLADEHFEESGRPYTEVSDEAN